MANFDVIVIGAGLNGLVAANYLAKAGKKVLVLERRAIAGGQAVTESFGDGFERVDALHAGGQLRPDIVRDLDLAGTDCRPRSSEPLISMLPDGRQLRLTADPGDQQTLASIAQLLETRCRTLAGVRRVHERKRRRSSTRPTARRCRGCRTSRSRKDCRSQSSRLQAAPPRAQGTCSGVIRALPMSALELTEEWFESDVVRAAIASVAIHGVTLGPMSAGTGYTLMHNWLNRGGPGHRRVEGGVGRIADALVAALKARGGELRLSADVKNCARRRQPRARRAIGGRRGNPRAACVISAADPRHTLLDLVGAPELPPEFVWHTQSIKMRGSVAKVHLLTDGNHGLPKGTLVIAPVHPLSGACLRRGQVR